MRFMGALIVVGAMSVGASVWVGAQSSRSAVEGAWMLQEYTFAKPANLVINKPTGLMLFTGNHYSMVFLRDSKPRPEFAEGGQGATVEQLLASWGPLQAQAGTFEISGNKLTTRASVAKGVPPMSKGAFGENTFTLKGDTLVLVSTRSQSGPTENARTLRLVRAK